MSAVLKFRGARALSDFRLAKLLPELKRAHSAVDGVAAEFWHFVEADAQPGPDERRVLERLLRYGADLEGEHSRAALFLVVPRLGTISPWSSKATDIARNCGLTHIRRIERGIAYYVSSGASSSADSHARIAPLLHDRMTRERPCSAGRGATAVPACRAAAAWPRAAAAAGGGQYAARPGIERRGDRLPAQCLPAARPRSNGRRTDDVRAGEFRALPPQDLQRRLDRRRRENAPVPVRHDPAHARRESAGHGAGLCRQ